ncbi:AraC family transcriptional regulator [Bosea sp. ASV33]|uniref:AraC family transcriptional regulator n=1 Tax=Bosea sp. ASV33 TaxID=2795106 RepID=UPI0018EC90C2|nr:AraC family transcriptional regulator [Bosea sp. ASV33]
MEMTAAGASKEFYGQRVADHFGMEGRLVSLFRLDGQPGLAATRLFCGRRFRERTQTADGEGAFSILHQIDDLEGHACWRGGQRQRSGAFRAKSVNVVDLREDPQWQFKGRFDALQFYVPAEAVATIAAQHGGRVASSLRWEGDARDEVLWGLSHALLHACAAPGANQLLVDQLALGLLVHFAQAYGGLETNPSARFGQLAAWQLRRAREIMAARLASNLTIAQVASECRLTPSHFARAFRQSTGVAPQRYLMQLRIAEAKEHLSQQHLPLSDIALMCGFGDQSHFTRVFRQLAGTSPGAWRRGQGDRQTGPDKLSPA